LADESAGEKTIPPAILADSAAQVLRVWPTAEPPLRYVCAHALAAAWEKDVPVNSVEAAWIVESMSQLLKDGKAPGDEGFSTAVQALLSAWEKRLELNRTPLFGWREEELTAPSLAGQMHLLARSQGSEASDKFLTLCIGEAARDASLWTALKVSESLQHARLFAEAARVIASITAEQENHPEVSNDRRMHLAIKRYHLPLNADADAGRVEAVKATLTLLTEHTDDATAWTRCCVVMV
jgi:hypothetical protein